MWFGYELALTATSPASSLIGIIVVAAYKNSILESAYPCQVPIDHAWRILIGLGCVPGVIALYFRLTIPETPRFTMDIERNVDQAAQDIENVLTASKYVEDDDAVVTQRVKAPRASRADFVAYFSKWKNGKVLLGTAYSWFALDVSRIYLQSIRPNMSLDRLLWSRSQQLCHLDCH